jgi:peptidoglycan/xylan/chitin deacetylase (PgdA/CDA1 family)
MRRPSFRGRRIGLVLCYHRVADDRPDPWDLCVSPRHFAEHLEVIASAAHPVPLAQLTPQRGGRAGGARPLVAVTFDDGYADNLHAAKPLLEAADVPATVFVVSGAIGRSGEFWWDELERAVLGPDPGPPTADVETWQAFRTAHQTLRVASRPEREATLSKLLDGQDAGPRESRRALTEQELLDLADGGLVEVGAHTVTHPVLSSLPEEEQRWEVARAKAELEGRLGRPVRMFAYPYGRRQDWTPATAQAVRESGYTLACTTSTGLVRGRSNAFALPRFCVPDWNGEQLGEALERWLRD